MKIQPLTIGIVFDTIKFNFNSKDSWNVEAHIEENNELSLVCSCGYELYSAEDPFGHISVCPSCDELMIRPDIAVPSLTLGVMQWTEHNSAGEIISGWRLKKRLLVARFYFSV